MHARLNRFKKIAVLVTLACFFFTLSFSVSVLEGSRAELKKEINSLPFTPFFEVYVESPLEVYSLNILQNISNNPDLILLGYAKEIDLSSLINQAALNYPKEINWNNIKMITKSDVNNLTKSPYIKDAFLVPPRLNAIRIKFKNRSIPLMSISPSFFKELQLPLKYGRYFSASDNNAVIITDSVSKLLFGDINPVGRKVLCINGSSSTKINESASENGCYYKIIGVLKPLTPEVISVLQNPFYAGGFTTEKASTSVSSTLLVIPKKGYYRKALAILKKSMRDKGSVQENAKCRIISTYKRTEELLTIDSRKKKLEYIFLAVLFMMIVGLFSVIGIIIFELSQKSREISIKMALGRSRKMLFNEYFWRYSILIALADIIANVFLIVLSPILKNFNVAGNSASPTIILPSLLATHSIRIGWQTIIVNIAAIFLISAIAVYISFRFTLSKIPAEGIKSDKFFSKKPTISLAKLLIIIIITIAISGMIFPSVLKVTIERDLSNTISAIKPSAVRISSFPETSTLSIMESTFMGANYTSEDYMELKRLMSGRALVGFRERLPSYFNVSLTKNGSTYVAEKIRVAEATGCMKNIYGLKVENGRFTKDIDYGKRICVLGYQIAKDLNASLGDSIIVGKNLDAYTVVGILQKNNFLLDKTVFCPNGSFPYTGYNSFSQITGNGVFLIEAKNSRDRLKVAQDALEFLNARHSDKSSGTIIDPERVVKPVLRIFTSLYTLLSVFLFLSLLSSFLSLSALLFIEVIRRTREIGIKKAIGATRREITKEFTLKGLKTTIIALSIGIPVGILISLIIEKLKGWSYYIPVNILILVISVSLLLGFMFSFLPAYFASKTNPVEAIKSE